MAAAVTNVCDDSVIDLLHRLTPVINRYSQPTRAWARKSKSQGFQHCHKEPAGKQYTSMGDKEDRPTGDLESHGNGMHHSQKL